MRGAGLAYKLPLDDLIVQAFDPPGAIMIGIAHPKGDWDEDDSPAVP
jgi:hypothetical protein